MTSTKPNVGNEGAQEANPGVSQKSVEGSDRELLEAVQEFRQELNAIKGDISGLYSRQDKDRNVMRGLMEEYERLKSGGMSSEAAMQKAEQTFASAQQAEKRERMLEEIYAKVFGQSNGNGAVQVSQVLQEAGLDLEDPTVRVLANRNYANEDELYKAIGQYVAKKPKQPNAAQEPSNSSKENKTPKASELIAELNTLYKNPTAHAARIAEIEEALGW